MIEATRCDNDCNDGVVTTITDDDDCPRCDGTGWLDGNGDPIDVDATKVDLGGGMVVPLRELLED